MYVINARMLTLASHLTKEWTILNVPLPFNLGLKSFSLSSVEACLCKSQLHKVINLFLNLRVNCGATVTDSPPTCKVSGLNPGRYVGKLVVAYPTVESLQYRT